MKLKITALLFGGLIAASAVAQPQLNLPPTATPTNEPVAPDREKLGYALGMNMGANVLRGVKAQDLDVSTDAILQGMKDTLAGQPTKLSEKEVTDLLQKDLRSYMMARRQWQTKELEAKGEKAKKDGEDFLAKNSKEDGVKTLPDGLQYKVLQEGTGDECTSNDVARVSYKGTLIDGTPFDENTNFNTRVTQVIKGWGEALQMMKVGSHWKLFVPADLAYGAHAQPPKIAPNSVLIFDMELLGVQKMPPRPAMPPSMTAHPTSMTMQGATNGSVVSGQIIRVPSKAELDKGAKIEVIDPNSTNAASAK